MDVDRLGRDIEIAHPENFLTGFVELIEKIPETPEPFKLVLELLVVRIATLRGIGVYNVQGSESARKDAGIFELVPVAKSSSALIGHGSAE